MIDLRLVLRADAAASGGMGLLLLVLNGPAEDRLGLPVALSLTVGVLLLAWAAFVLWVAQAPTRVTVRAVAALNIAYVAASVGFAFADVVRLTDLGVVLVLAQAAAVLAFAAAQLVVRPVVTRQAATA